MPELRTQSAGTKVTEKEYAEIEKLAESRGLKVGEWCRETLLARVNVQEPRAPLIAPAPARWQSWRSCRRYGESCETAQVNIKCPFHGYPSRPHNASLEHIAVNLDRTVIDVHAVLLIVSARAGHKPRQVSPSLDATSEGSEVPVPSVV